MSRAVTAYIDNDPRFVTEASGLYASWRAIKGDTNPIDIVFYVHPDMARTAEKRMNCTLDVAVNNKSDCFIVKHDTPDVVMNKYKFLKSIEYLLGNNSDFLRNYDFVMKTDCDTFITPAFSRWKPSVFHTGKGAFEFLPETRMRVHRWAARLGYPHRGLFNLGATWYGPPDQVIQAAQLAYNVTVELHERAFGPDVKDKGWPLWHQGVSSMYGQEISINHLIRDAQPTRMIDFPSDVKASVNNVYHIHCFHTDSFYSKFANAKKWYDSVNSTGWDMSDVRHWSLEMMLRGKGIRSHQGFIQTWPEGLGWVTPNYTFLRENPLSKGI